MAGYIRQLIDEAKLKIYPVTQAKAVYINKTDTVDRMLNDLVNSNGMIEFKTNEIIQKKASGAVVTIKFAGNVITESTVDDKGRPIQIKTTTINDDGTIKIESSEVGTWDMTIDTTTDSANS